MIKVGIVGISGYSGFTALEILLRHKGVRVSYVSANNTTGKVADIWPKLAGQTNLYCGTYELKKAVELCDAVILAVPHTVSMQLAPELLKAQKKVIDLSGDYRLKSKEDYKKWYGTNHVDNKNLKEAVYGLPELYREDIKKASLISNPGCYPTAGVLALAPVVAAYAKDISSVIIDAKSGVSGAGRKVKLDFVFPETNENFKAYKVLKHQHEPEIALYLSKLAGKNININFVPHLLPINRGILETIYVHLKKPVGLHEAHKMVQKFYKTEPFVRLVPLGQQPEIKNVAYTNFCDIGLAASEDGKLLCITSAIDNLLKGASGQAVQNLNIMYGFKETEGLV